MLPGSALVKTREKENSYCPQKKHQSATVNTEQHLLDMINQSGCLSAKCASTRPLSHFLLFNAHPLTELSYIKSSWLIIMFTTRLLFIKASNNQPDLIYSFFEMTKMNLMISACVHQEVAVVINIQTQITQMTGYGSGTSVPLICQN